MVKKNPRINLEQGARYLYGLEKPETPIEPMTESLINAYREMGMSEKDLNAMIKERSTQAESFGVLSENWQVLQFLGECVGCWRFGAWTGRFEGFDYQSAQSLAHWLEVPNDVLKRFPIAVKAILTASHKAKT